MPINVKHYVWFRNEVVLPNCSAYRNVELYMGVSPVLSLDAVKVCRVLYMDYEPVELGVLLAGDIDKLPSEIFTSLKVHTYIHT